MARSRRNPAAESALAAAHVRSGQDGRQSGSNDSDAPAFSAVATRKLVYRGRFTLVVGEIRHAQDKAQKLAENMGGYLESLEATLMVIRVPAEKFHQAVRSLRNVGSVAQRDVEVVDVTDQYRDTETRLENYKAMAKRLRELVAKAEDVKAALEVERELGRIQTEIDKLEGQLRTLSQQVAFARIHLTFQGVTRYTPPKIQVKLPIGWLRELGLQRLMRFDGKEIY
jgi:ABC-type uncharacterized transport system fused permease/ATPase subunit